MVMSEDNLTYHKVLDKNKPIYLAWDNIYTSSQTPTAADRRAFNAFIAKLRAAGLNIVRTKQGPDQLGQNVLYLQKNCIKNAIVINCMNGVDPANIKEAPKYDSSKLVVNKCSNGAVSNIDWDTTKRTYGVTLKAGENSPGVAMRENNNDMVLGWFRDAPDCTIKGGRGVTRGIVDGTSNIAYLGRFRNPDQYMKQHQIIGLCSSSDEHTRAGDPEGLKLADMIIDLFKEEGESGEGGSDSPITDLDNAVETPNSDSNKTLTKRVVKQVYKVPWYEKILTTKTDDNGAFLIKQPADMKIKGEYLVNLYFAGDTTHEACNRSIRIQKMSGDVVNDELLESTTTEYYSDGSSQETNHTGSSPKDNSIKTKTITITYTYEGGVLKNTDIKTVENYKVIEPAQETENIVNIVATPDEVNNNAPTPTGNADPFSNDVALLSDGSPNVNAMSTGGKKYVMYDENKTYHLNQSQFREVYDRDSKSLQLNSYKVSKYTAFQSTDTQTYNVIPRMRWNPVAQAVHRWLCANDGASWFNEITINFGSLNCVIDGTNVPFTGKEREYHVVVDHQDNISEQTGTCGPTSCSMATAWLYRYVSENKLKRPTGHGHGIAPEGATKGLNSLGFNAKRVSGKENWMNGLREGKPIVFFEGDHYVCLYDIDGDRILAGNPGGCYSGFCSGWRSSETVNREGRGRHNVVALAWSISEDEKQRINHFYKSMGGAWNRPSNSRTLPIIWNGSIRDRS